MKMRAMIFAAAIAAGSWAFAQEAVDDWEDVSTAPATTAASAPASSATSTATTAPTGSGTSSTPPANTGGGRNPGRGSTGSGSGNGNGTTRNPGRGGVGGGGGGGRTSMGGTNVATPEIPAGVTILPPEDQVMAQYSMFSRERVIRYARPAPPPETRPAREAPVAPPPPLPVLRGMGLPEHGDANAKPNAMIEFADGTSQLFHVGEKIEGLKGGQVSAIDELGVELVGDDGKTRRVALGQDLAGSESGSSASSGSSSSSTATSSAPLPPTTNPIEEMLRRRRQQENNR